jgi:hypothetical protein
LAESLITCSYRDQNFIATHEPRRKRGIVACPNRFARNGKAVIFDYTDKAAKIRYGELVNPIILSDISDNKIKIRSEEEGI